MAAVFMHLLHGLDTLEVSSVSVKIKISMLRPVLFCSALLTLAVVSALPQIHYSGSATTPFRSQGAQSSISAEAITVTLASLLSINPTVPVKQDVSRQVRATQCK